MGDRLLVMVYNRLMLILASKLNNFPVLSLQIGTAIARTDRAIIDPAELKLVAFSLSKVIGDAVKPSNILMLDDVREFSLRGFIIDSAESLIDADDVLKIQQIMALHFDLIGLKVVSESGKKIGKIIDYSVDINSFMIYQIIVRRPTLQSFVTPELTINRSQITEIDDYSVTIRNDSEKISLEAPVEDFQPNFVNPFRQKPKLQENEFSEEK